MPAPPTYNSSLAPPPGYTPVVAQQQQVMQPPRQPINAPPSGFASVPSADDGKLTISFTLNGAVVSLDPSAQKAQGINANTKLAEYLRTTKWTGTKIGCNEGGCGACTVALTFEDPVSNATTTRAINSCLRPLYSCNGMSITTNDGLGTPANPHAIQSALAAANGSQCGYCSNGMVMNLYALITQHPNLTKLQIEQAYDGNICRCTGYRQIMKAMKQFASDADPANGTFADDENFNHHKHDHDDHHGCDEKSCLQVGCKRRGAFPELEDLDKLMKVPEIVKSYKHNAPISHKKLTGKSNLKMPYKLTINSNGTVWQDCPTLADLEFWLDWYTTNNQNPMLVVAQTSLGIYPEQVAVKLNIAHIPELTTITQSPTTGITIGPSCPIFDVMEYVRTAVGPNSYSANHLGQMADHFGRVASKTVRNIASVVGNMFVCHAHQSDGDFFPSDVCIVLMGLGATVTYKNASSQAVATVSMTDFFHTSFTGCYVTAITVPWAKENEKFMSFKAALRQVDSHALVNSAMRAVVDPATNIISGTPTIAVGGVFHRPTRMTAIETALASGSFNVTSATAFQALATTMQGLLVPAQAPPGYGGSPAYRISVAVTQFYKFFLFLQPANGLGPAFESANQAWFVRPESKGSTQFTPDPRYYPVDIGTTKVEAIQQTTGHAKYTDDLMATEDTAYAHLVLAEQGNCTFTGIDATVAMSMTGFVAFYTAADLSTDANMGGNGPMFQPLNAKIDHAGKVLGMVVATTAQNAADAAKHGVQVSYGSDLATNIVTVQQAVTAGKFYETPMITPVIVGDAKAVIKAAAATNKVTGATAQVGGQFHFHLENQSSYVIPREDVYEVHVATQAPPMVQGQIAATLGIPQSKVIVQTKRCGGGFGGKIGNSVLPATLCAVAAMKLQVPVKLVLPMHQAMELLGARGERVMNYDVAFENDGTITAFDALIYCAGGAALGGSIGGAIVNLQNLDNCYKIPNFHAAARVTQMNIPPVTACRGPGWVPAIQLCEMMISQVAAKLQMAPEDVRAKNFFKKGESTADGMTLPYWNIPKIWTQLQTTSDFAARKAATITYNAANKWIKRGIAMMPVRFAVGQAGANFDSIVNIYPDGTIGVTIGGSEIGQGINTKVIQVVAYKLGLSMADIGLITVNETCTRSISSANNVTGGSITSELCSLSVMHACETLNARLAPFRTPNQTWQALIGMTNGSVQLTATGWTAAPMAGNPAGFNYNSTSAAVCEVELNCLSGEFEVRRVDILFDCGISLNPIIDIGQVQGGFVFGQGYFTQEQIRYDPTTGKCLDATTWNYKPPSAYDVPLEFNVALLANSPNPVGVLSSKASGEPGVCIAAVVTQALENAVSACTGTRWCCDKAPLTVPALQAACAPAVADFNFS